MSENKRDYDNIFLHVKNNAVYERAMTYIEMVMSKSNENKLDSEKFIEIKEIVLETIKHIETKNSKEKTWDNHTLGVSPSQLDYTFDKK